MSRRKVLTGMLALLALLAAGGYWGIHAYAEAQVAAEIKRIEGQLASGGRIDYDDIAVAFRPRRVRIDGLRLLPSADATPLQMERVVVRDFERKRALTTRLDAEFHGVRQRLEALPAEQAASLRELGYEHIRGHYTLSYDYDLDEGRLNVERLSARVERMAKVDLSFALSGLHLDPDRPLNAQRSQFFSVDLGRALMRYRDESLMSRIIERVAQVGGMSRAQAVDRLGTELDRHAMGVIPEDARLALKAFLRDPGTLRLSAEPSEPVSAARLISLALVAPRRLPAVLNLNITAE